MSCRPPDTIDGLLLIDTCSPRTEIMQAEGFLSIAMLDDISRRDESGVWNMTDSIQRHLQVLFASVAVYDPQLLRAAERSPVERMGII
ncbi:hypothetical protein N0V82_002338 [Gnomoniopsis sp. IMI 355080]|nr:hypothetical protein N0V82_002338 [Gnomoniopsis sp. IMI 355080]